MMGQQAWIHNKIGKPIADLQIFEDEILLMFMDGEEIKYQRVR
jgi:hypothetical protein